MNNYFRSPRRNASPAVAIFLALFFSLASPPMQSADSPVKPEAESPTSLHTAPPVIPLPPTRPATKLLEHTQGEIWFDSRSPFDFDVLLSNYNKAAPNSTRAFLYLPAGATAKNPAPTMVFLPGSGGIRLGRQMLLADFLVENGYGVAVVDYYFSRGIDIDKVPYQLMVSNVTEFDIVADAYSALNALQQHPAIDGDRIGVVGFSYGGMATRLALDDRIRKLLAKKGTRFRAHIDFYGPCFQDFKTVKTTGAPLLTLRGELDASNDLVACVQREEELRAAGSSVGAISYANAGHAWEGLRPMQMNSSPHVRGCTMRYDQAGIPSVNGNVLIAANAPTDRATRYRMRMESGRFFSGCLETGYYVGRHAGAHRQSKAAMLEFLQQQL